MRAAHSHVQIHMGSLCASLQGRTAVQRLHTRACTGVPLVILRCTGTANMTMGPWQPWHSMCRLKSSTSPAGS